MISVFIIYNTVFLWLIIFLYFFLIWRLGKENVDGECMNRVLNVCQVIQDFQKFQTAHYLNIMQTGVLATLQSNDKANCIVFIFVAY